MTSITSTGVGSGLDVETLVSKLVAAESTPITQLQTRTDKLQTQLSAYGKLQSYLSTLRDAASKLNAVDTWAPTKASSSNSSAVTVSASSSATAGSLAVAVNQLAASQTLASGVIASSGSVGTGSITIELGTWASDGSFTTKDGSTAVTIDIASGSDTLTAIRDKINAAGAGVVASIVTDTSGSRLVMRSKDTGESNGFRVSVSDADGNGADTSGLSALAYDPSAGVSSMTLKSAAANANATINGIDVVSATNKLTTAVEGLTINLLQTTSSDVTLTVEQDKDTIKSAITAFANAYNDAINYIRDQTKYDAANKTAATLQGDSTVIALQSMLRGIVGGGTTLGGAFQRLADIGLDPSSTGTLTVSSTKLDTALSNLDDLKSMFKGLDSSDSRNSGFAQRMREFVDGALSTAGRVSAKQTSLQSSITANGKRKDQLQAHIDLVEKRLRAQYQALDTQMSKLNSLSSYVSQQMSMLSKSSS